MSAQLEPVLILYLLAGLGLGLGFFGMLLWAVRLQAAGASVGRILPLYLLRYALAAACFWLIAQQGALPLLTALAGFMVGRFVIQRRGLPS